MSGLYNFAWQVETCTSSIERIHFLSDQEIDGEAFVELSEDDVKGLTDKLGVVKISRLVNEVSLVLCKIILVPRR